MLQEEDVIASSNPLPPVSHPKAPVSKGLGVEGFGPFGGTLQQILFLEPRLCSKLTCW